jgi:hypothetical protein
LVALTDKTVIKVPPMVPITVSDAPALWWCIL